MGKLSPENRLLVERVATEIAAEYWLAGYTFEIGPLQLNRLLDAARSEGQPSGYDGGKSLGERLCAACVSASDDGGATVWDRLPREVQSWYERAALTFTASLSDASPKPAEGPK